MELGAEISVLSVGRRNEGGVRSTRSFKLVQALAPEKRNENFMCRRHVEATIE